MQKCYASCGEHASSNVPGSCLYIADMYVDFDIILMDYVCVCAPAILLLVFEIWSQRALPFLLVSDQEDPWKRYSQVHKDRRGMGTLSQIPSSALSCVDKKPDTSKHVTERERERDNYRSNQLHTILHTANIFNTCLSLEISLFFSHYRSLCLCTCVSYIYI